MAAIESVRRSLVLRRRPDGEPRVEDFAMVEDPIPVPGAGEVLTRTLMLSIDPYMRGRISGRASYATPVAIGGVMTGESVGEVLASGDAGFVAGDGVVGSADEFGRQGYPDPAVICRGPEYLRILYGPEYLLPKNLELLRSRDLGANRSLSAASSRSALSRSRFSRAKIRCAGPTSGPLAFWLWRASSSIRAC